MGFASLLMAGCLLWIPIIGWVLAPIFFLVAIVPWVWALVPSGRLTFQCQACKHWFTVPKSELSAGA